MLAALDILAEFDEIACVAVKHMNPCGVAIGKDVLKHIHALMIRDPCIYLWRDCLRLMAL